MDRNKGTNSEIEMQKLSQPQSAAIKKAVQGNDANLAWEIFDKLNRDYKSSLEVSNNSQKSRLSSRKTVTAKSDGVDLGLKIAAGSFLVAAASLAVIGLIMTFFFPPAVLPILATAGAFFALAAITGLIKGVRSFIRDKMAKSEAARNEAGGTGKHDTCHERVEKVAANTQAFGSGQTVGHQQAVESPAVEARSGGSLPPNP